MDTRENGIINKIALLLIFICCHVKIFNLSIISISTYE